MATDFKSIALQKIKNVASSLGKKIQEASVNPVLNPSGYLANKVSNWAFPEQGKIIKQLSTPEGQQQFNQETSNDLRTNVRQYIGNRYVAPVAQVPYNLGQALGKNKTIIERGAGALGVLGGTIAMVPDPIGDVAMPVYDYLKGVTAAQRQGQDTIQSYKTGIKSLTGQQYTGLGTVTGQTGVAEQAVNLAELPLVLFMGGKLSKSLEANKLVREAQPEIVNLINANKNFDAFGGDAQIKIIDSLQKTAEKFIPQVVKSKEMKKLANQDNATWRKYIATFLEDRLVLANNPEIQVGGQARAIKRLDTQPTKGEITDLKNTISEINKQTGSKFRVIEVPAKYEGEFRLRGTDAQGKDIALRGTPDFIKSQISPTQPTKGGVPEGGIKVNKPFTKETNPVMGDIPFQKVEKSIESKYPTNTPIDEYTGYLTTNGKKAAINYTEVSHRTLLNREGIPGFSEQFYSRYGGIRLHNTGKEMNIEIGNTPTAAQMVELNKLSTTKPINYDFYDSQSGQLLNSKAGISKNQLIQDIKTYYPSPKPEAVSKPITPEVPSSRTEIRTKMNQEIDQISKPILEKQLKGEITTPTTAVSEVPSKPIIRQKSELNLEKLNVQGEAKKALKDINTRVKPTVIGNKEVVAQARTAKGTGAMSDEQMKKLLAQQLKNRQKVVDLGVRFNQAKEAGASEVELGKIMLDMANQSKVARQGGTFAGRLLQAQNILADQSATPTQKILALLDNAGVPPEKYLKDSVKVDWNNPKEVVDFYRKYVPPKFGEVLDEIRYSNMLSSPLTHIINTFSNALQTAVVAPVEKTLTGALDWGKSALTGSERQYYASAGIDYAGGYVKSLPEAFKKAADIMTGKKVMVKPDYQRIPTGTGGALGAYTTPLRMLEAADQFFKTLVEGGVTKELKKAPGKLSVEEIAGRSSREADYRLFRQAFDSKGELGQGKVLQLFDQWNSAIANLRRLPGGKWVLPFLQTPTNILKQGLEYSPLGISTIPGSKAPIEQLSKTLIGTSVFMGAYQLAQNGLTTWGTPNSESERELFYSAGMQPYSLKIGDNWVSFSKLGPLSYPIAMAAALGDAERNNPDKKYTDNIGQALSGILGFFGDQSYVRSIGDLVDAVQGGVNIGSSAISAEAANLAGQLIPFRSFMTWLGRITDPTYRKATSFTERLSKDLPVIGKNLKPYTDLYGQPSKRDYPVFNAFSPLRATQEKPQEKTMLDKYQAGRIQRSVEKRADEEYLKGNKDQTITGKVFRYIDEGGSLRKIDTTKVSSMPSSTAYEKALKEKAAYSLADDILKLERPEDQAQAFVDIGISPEDAVYYNTAKQEVRLKSLYIDEEISKLDTKDRSNLINYLVNQRKEVNGSMVLTNSIVDDLADKDIISETEATMLKNLKIVEGKAVTKLTGRGKSTTLKKVSSLPAPTQIKAPNMKTLLAKTGKLKVKKYKFRRTL